MLAAYSRQSRQGFTLVELLIVIVIIAILGGITLAVGGGVLEGQRVSRAQAEMQTIAQALDTYQRRHYEYPAFTGEKALTQALVGTEKNGKWVIRVPERSPAGQVRMVEAPNERPILREEIPLGDENGLLADPWGNPYVYFYVKEDAMGTPPSQRNWKNPSYILLSTGADGELDGTGINSTTGIVDAGRHFSKEENYDNLIYGYEN